MSQELAKQLGLGPEDPPPKITSDLIDYFDSTKPGYVKLFLAESCYTSSPDWYVCIEILALNLVTLMCEGIHWTEDNICPDGVVDLHASDRIKENLSKMGYPHYQDWGIECKPTDVPKWVGAIMVFTKREDMLANFRPRDLRVEQVFEAFAIVCGSEEVYRYEMGDPVKNYNEIAGELPLDGWWPWPKAEGEAGEEDGEYGNDERDEYDEVD